MTHNLQTSALEGKVALVMGASRGIGAEIARAYAAGGASVVLAARDERALLMVADAVVYLSSERSSFVTGTVPAVDGGMLAGTPSFQREVAA